MLKDLLERFKRVFTVKDWKLAAQDAMRKREFVIASLDELHRIERADAERGQDRTHQRQPNQPRGQQGYVFPSKPMDDGRQNDKANMSLADLMNSIRRQQTIN